MQSKYFNFINSLNSSSTKKQFSFCLEQFLGYCKLDLHKFLKLPDKENSIIKYLVEKKVSKAYKNVIFSPIKHACEVNDVLLNFRK